jgi:hypothetical protein
MVVPQDLRPCPSIFVHELEDILKPLVGKLYVSFFTEAEIKKVRQRSTGGPCSTPLVTSAQN